MNCKITAQKCQPVIQTITVTPRNSRVTLECSIKTGGNTQDMTWQGLERNLEASEGLYLVQIYSTDVNHSRGCFSIKYAGEHFLLSPFSFQQKFRNSWFIIKTSRWINFGLLFTVLLQYIINGSLKTSWAAEGDLSTVKHPLRLE